MRRRHDDLGALRVDAGQVLALGGGHALEPARELRGGSRARGRAR